jgi:hypothetical protein
LKTSVLNTIFGESCFDGLLMRTSAADDCIVYTDLMLHFEVLDRVFVVLIAKAAALEASGPKRCFNQPS